MKKMKLIFLLVLFTQVGNVYGKKLTYPIEVVAGMADLIVTGEIEKVHSHTYVFKIAQTIKGKSHQRITVHMFKEWTCDRRIRKPEVGQKLFLFLNKKIFSYESINGSTGEMFIDEDRVVGDIDGSRPTIAELSDALQIFVSCYTLKGKKYHSSKGTIFIQNKSDDEIGKLYSTSVLVQYFFDKMKQYMIEKKDSEK